MPRPKKWVKNGYRSFKVKVDINTHERYKEKLKKRKPKITAQDDLSDYIEAVINN